MPNSHEPVDMAARLQRYGVSPEQALTEPLIVPPRKILEVSVEQLADKKRGMVELRPKSIAQVKEWIGIPNSVARRYPRELPRLTNVRLGPPEVSRARTPALNRNLYQLAKAFVHGDSEGLDHYIPILDKLLVEATIVGIFLLSDIDVYGTLDIAPSLKVLLARDVRIWGDGVIRFHGAGKIDCVSIQGKRKGFQIDPSILKVVPVLGKLRDLEVPHA